MTGSLHIGHALQHSIMDALTRYHRMRGKNTLWQVGTDHAGIATQMVVERKLAEGKPGREELGRDPFIEKIWQWKAQSGDTITCRCGVWVTQWIGIVSALPWMMASIIPFRSVCSPL